MEFSQQYVASTFKDIGHAVCVMKDNGAAAYCMKEDTRVSGPLEWGVKGVHGGDHKSITVRDALAMKYEDMLDLSMY